jgi:hypothetical protein
MIDFDAYRPNPCTPQLFVNKVGGIYRLSQSITKMAFTLSTGSEAVETASLLWENAALYEAQHCLDWALREMQRGTFRIDEGGRRILAH